MAIRTTAKKKPLGGTPEKTKVTATVDNHGGGGGGTFEANVIISFNSNSLKEVGMKAGGESITDANTGIKTITWSDETIDNDGTEFWVDLECKNRSTTDVNCLAVKQPDGPTSNTDKVEVGCP